MEKILIKADARADVGKGAARSLRRAGMLPAVMYSEGKSTPLTVEGKQLTKLLFSGMGEHSLLTVSIGDGAGEHSVLMKDYQLDPVTDELLHVDFIEISLQKKINIKVLVDIVEKPLGIKMGGTMEIVRREISVECLPTDIMAAIAVDASHIGLGQSLYVRDLIVTEGIRITTNPNATIIKVSAPKVDAGKVAAAEPAKKGKAAAVVKEE
ncbi:MAG: 50S ribosomal protein L25 [Nitrospira sp.]|nr:50S ribosomal protein L25 [bacterium]MBL7048948.1 50S ribosomal protein L25 [Nitrospira sp.]